ncbi:MAG: aminotransferase class I/II-fold pyridoxal phosphate-dependent enzyme, partial [Candidatus Thermoplasmatota archaeon]|nr:aminotransferase class I/II-fold pyridoxal phosphate-dependent enzyme [Candidatus Thermoplasmatota archaeon]MBU1940419.1 aminotransferase class I/II-fold pyridoxal phosphate-dependent enzyme [Candidatus Thermoplasmatota archaeon]
MVNLSKGASRIYGEAAFEVLAKAQELERQKKSILHFEIGEPDIETPENIIRAGIRAIQEKKTHYTPSIGITDLRKVIQDEVEKTRGYRPDLEQVVITPGLKPGIFFSMLAIVDPGDEVIYQDPGYPTYGSVVAFLGAQQIMVPLLEENEFRMSPDDIRERITKKTKLIVVNSPQNPTGSVMTKSEMEELAELAEQHDIYVVSDEIYSKMTYDTRHYSPTVRDEAKERTVLLDGFSKYYAMTGWRLGYMVVPHAMAERLQDFLVSAVSCTAAFTQWAGIEALTGDQSFIPEMMARFKEKRNRIVEGLNSVPGFRCQVPRGAFYAFPNIKGTGMTSQ